MVEFFENCYEAFDSMNDEECVDELTDHHLAKE
jgi:hypothetical protein